MSKTKEYKPFPGVTCQRIRNLIAEMNRCESSRKSMFEARDNALSELVKLADGGHSAKRAQLEADYGRACIDIDVLEARIKWARGELKTTIEKADEPTLWQSADLEPPDFTKPEPQEMPGDDAKAKDPRPIGRPAPAAKEGPGPQGSAAPDGQDEHLKVSVKELDLPELIIGRLVKASFDTVGHVVTVLDSDADLSVVANIDEKAVAEVKKAVAKFRKSHRAADRAANAKPPKGQGLKLAHG